MIMKKIQDDRERIKKYSFLSVLLLKKKKEDRKVTNKINMML